MHYISNGYGMMSTYCDVKGSTGSILEDVVMLVANTTTGRGSIDSMFPKLNEIRCIVNTALQAILVTSERSECVCST